LLSKVGIVYKIMKFLLVLAVGYLAVLLIASMFMPQFKDVLLQPVNALWDLLQSFLRELGL